MPCGGGGPCCWLSTVAGVAGECTHALYPLAQEGGPGHDAASGRTHGGRCGLQHGSVGCKRGKQVRESKGGLGGQGVVGWCPPDVYAWWGACRASFLPSSPFPSQNSCPDDYACTRRNPPSSSILTWARPCACRAAPTASCFSAASATSFTATRAWPTT